LSVYFSCCNDYHEDFHKKYGLRVDRKKSI
jgi:hypothetical protein